MSEAGTFMGFVYTNTIYVFNYLPKSKVMRLCLFFPIGELFEHMYHNSL